MPSRWFRFYSEALNDPKILRLTDRQYRVWTQLLCIAGDNDGRIAIKDLDLVLRMKAGLVERIVADLIKAELIEQDDETFLAPHNWKNRQYKSDVSTPRVKRFREHERNVTETPSESDTETEQNRTESETDADRAPAFPFALTFAKEHQRRNAGRPPSPILHAAAIALEREYGAAACIQAAGDFDWQKHPNYLRPLLEERRTGAKNGHVEAEAVKSLRFEDAQ